MPHVVRKHQRSARFPIGLPWMALVLGLAVLVVSCEPEKDRETLRRENMIADLAWKTSVAPAELVDPFDLDHAVEYGLNHNLQAALAEQEAQIRAEAATGARMRMLPSLVLGKARSKRSNKDASKSKTLFTDNVGNEPSYSEPQIKDTTDLAMTWNLLDFGINFFRVRQAAHRVWMAQEQTRRVRQRLALDIAEAYWNAQTARQAMQDAQAFLAKAEARQEIIRKEIREKLVSRMAGLEAESEIYETRLRLQSLEDNFKSSKARLASLMGLPVGTPFELVREDFPARVDSSAALPFESLEEEALLNRPEMRAMDAEEQVAADNVRIALARMFPNASLFARYDRDANDFLYEHNWYSIGLNATMDLLSFPGKIRGRQEAKLETDLIRTRRMMTAIGIISQVYLASIERGKQLRSYGLLSEITAKRMELLAEARKNEQEGQASGRDVFGAEQKAFFARLRSLRSYADLQIAEARLRNSLGRERLTGPLVAQKKAPPPSQTGNAPSTAPYRARLADGGTTEMHETVHAAPIPLALPALSDLPAEVGVGTVDASEAGTPESLDLPPVPDLCETPSRLVHRHERREMHEAGHHARRQSSSLNVRVAPAVTPISPRPGAVVEPEGDLVVIDRVAPESAQTVTESAPLATVRLPDAVGEGVRPQPVAKPVRVAPGETLYHVPYPSASDWVGSRSLDKDLSQAGRGH